MASDLPPGRYDAPRRSARALSYLLSGLLAAGLLAGAYALYARSQSGRLPAQLLRYDVQSDTLVRITFDVVNGDRAGECKVRARGRDGAEAGAQVVPVAASSRRSQQVTVELATRSRAVTGELVGCRLL